MQHAILTVFPNLPKTNPKCTGITNMLQKGHISPRRGKKIEYAYTHRSPKLNSLNILSSRIKFSLVVCGNVR